MKMKLVFIAAIGGALLAAAGNALAADLPIKAPVLPPPAPSWTGFYGGVNGGWGWADVNATVSPFGGAALADFGPQAIGGSNANGAVFGAQAGYNWQFNPAWVIGIEGDVDGAGTGTAHNVTTTSSLEPLGNVGFGASSKLDYLISVRGRIGYVWGQGLLYFTGGGAWAGFTHDGIVSTNTAPGAVGQSVVDNWTSNASGYVIGGGYEWMVADHWTVRGEYLYYNFSSNNNNRPFSYPVCADGNACGASVNFGNTNISVARFAVNYKF
jgi:outer membrane immunogenic protein